MVLTYIYGLVAQKCVKVWNFFIEVNQYSSNASVATCLWNLRIEPIIATVYIVAKRRQWRRRGQYSE